MTKTKALIAIGIIVVLVGILTAVNFVVAGKAKNNPKGDLASQNTNNDSEDAALFNCPDHNHEHSENPGSVCSICGEKMVPVPDDELQFHHHDHDDDEHEHDDGDHAH